MFVVGCRKKAALFKSVMSQLNKIVLENFQLVEGDTLSKVILSYQVFGKPLGTAPLVLVNHALTGNSQVTGENGWWNDLIGEHKTIDTQRYTVLAFNIPGNGFLDATNLIENYKAVTTFDIAKMFWDALDILKVKEVFAVIGGSLGGAIAWEMATIRPQSIQNLIPIATSWKSSDWLIGNVLIQDLILNNSKNPIHDARVHAMLLYRTPESLHQKFKATMQEGDGIFQVESWLLHHGKKLHNRFNLASYKLMSHLLKTINALKNQTIEELAKTITANVYLVSVDTDYFFTADEIRCCYTELKKYKQNVSYYQIESIHGHDAFLIEYKQLHKILKSIFKL